MLRSGEGFRKVEIAVEQDLQIEALFANSFQRPFAIRTHPEFTIAATCLSNYIEYKYLTASDIILVHSISIRQHYRQRKQCNQGNFTSRALR
jgi:hypothetical protein